MERFLPRVIYQNLIDRYPRDKLVKMLTYIAQHPEKGTVIDDVTDLGIPVGADLREDAYLLSQPASQPSSVAAYHP